MRIEYTDYGLTLNSVGSKTVMNNLQVSYSAQDAFEFLGGTVNAKKLVSVNSYCKDIYASFGNQSKT